MTWRDRNFGKSPFDPDYDDTYDRMQDYEDFCTAIEEREEADLHGRYALYH